MEQCKLCCCCRHDYASSAQTVRVSEDIGGICVVLRYRRDDLHSQSRRNSKSQDKRLFRRPHRGVEGFWRRLLYRRTRIGWPKKLYVLCFFLSPRKRITICKVKDINLNYDNSKVVNFVLSAEWFWKKTNQLMCTIPERSRGNVVALLCQSWK